MPELGTHLWPRLAAAYIEARLAPVLPADDSDLTAFDRVRWKSPRAGMTPWAPQPRPKLLKLLGPDCTAPLVDHLNPDAYPYVSS